jgi:DNA-binding response OmpR family regulator
VILDLMLPKLNGYDLWRRVRGEGFRAPILMLSARPQEGDRVLGLDLGANDFVNKPFSLRELLARVRALLQHERDRRQDEERLSGEMKLAQEVQQELFRRVLPEAPGFVSLRPRLGQTYLQTPRQAIEHQDRAWSRVQVHFMTGGQTIS